VFTFKSYLTQFNQLGPKISQVLTISNPIQGSITCESYIIYKEWASQIISLS